MTGRAAADAPAVRRGCAVRGWHAVLAVLALTLLVGCSDPPAEPALPSAETTTTTPPPSTSPPPTPEEVAAEAALAAQQAYVDLDVRSAKDPARDWTAEYTALLAEPARSSGLDSVAFMRERSLVSQGTWTTEPRVDEVQLTPAGEVTIWSCRDVTDWTTIRTDTGQVVDDPEQPLRFPLVFRVIQAEDGRWQVADTTPYREQTC